MTCYNLVLYSFVILVVYFTKYNSALNIESILGGHYDEEHSVKHQVEIIAKQNFSSRRKPICGGGIISPNLIISAAHCFIALSGELHEESYSIITDTTDLSAEGGISIDVGEIYIPYFDLSSRANDLAILKLIEALDIYKNKNLEALKLPKASDNFEGKEGIVSGFGFTWVTTGIKENGVLGRTDGDSDFLLYYSYIEVTNEKSCKKYFVLIKNNFEMCALAKPKKKGEISGVCTGDSGSPVVIDKKVIGIVVKNSIDCDDTLKGFIYTMVTAYVHIIHSIILGFPGKFAKVYYNRPHILHHKEVSDSFGKTWLLDRGYEKSELENHLKVCRNQADK